MADRLAVKLNVRPLHELADHLRRLAQQDRSAARATTSLYTEGYYSGRVDAWQLAAAWVEEAIADGENA